MGNTNIPETKVHSYNVSVAADVGINAAVVFYNICFWVEENHANKRNFINGKYWTYNTVKALHTIFPEMTGKQIEYALKKLKDGGYIESAILSEDTRDRTNWYTVCDFKKWILHEKPTPQEKEVPNQEKESSSENSEMPSDDSAMFNNINNNIDFDTDNNRSNKNQTNNKPTNNSHKGENINKVNGETKTSSSENRKKMTAPKTALEKYLGKKADEQDMIERLAAICSENYDNDTANEIFISLTHYFERFKEKSGKIHPILKDSTLLRFAEKMDCFYDDRYSHFGRLIGQDNAYIKMVDMFLDGDFGAVKGYETNYHLSAFMSDEVLNRMAQRLFELGEVE